MLNNILTKIMGSKNDRTMKKLHPIVDQISALEPQTEKLSDILLGEKTIFNEADVTLVMGNSIIAFTQLGPAMHCDGTLNATITCTDIFGNDGGALVRIVL